MDTSFLKKMPDMVLDYSGSILLAAIILVVGLLLIKACLGITRRALDKSKTDPSIHAFIIQVIKYALYVVLLVVILSSLKVPTAPLVTVLGAMGAAVALALKDSLSNVAAGIMILIKKPFKKGDFVVVGGYEGLIEKIDVTNTTVLTVDNRTVILPNSTVANNAIINATMEKIRRIDVTYSISYDSDIEKAREVINNICLENGNVLLDPAPFIGVGAHGESGIMIDLRCWVETPLYLPTKYELMESVKLAFDEAGITIPYNQITVHLEK